MLTLLKGITRAPALSSKVLLHTTRYLAYSQQVSARMYAREFRRERSPARAVDTLRLVACMGRRVDGMTAFKNVMTIGIIWSLAAVWYLISHKCV